MLYEVITLLQAQRILAIPLKKNERKSVNYLSENILKDLLACPDQSRITSYNVCYTKLLRKSTLLSKLSAANPKIADYPFTTLEPQLGVLQHRFFNPCIIADIPGLIEGAHEGLGLGHKFLRHIERTSIILHLLDISDDNYRGNYSIIENELLSYRNNFV